VPSALWHITLVPIKAARRMAAFKPLRVAL
jgi:hypothetical protein